LQPIEHQAHTRARLESFSDIVFGFSLAQLALALPTPSHVSELKWTDIFLFVATFTAVSFLWWRHHIIFRDIFVPERWSIVLNFVMLAAVALSTYAIQAQFRGHMGLSSVVLYATVLGVTFLSLSGMIARGLPRREGMTEETRLAGKRLMFAFGGIGIVFLGSIALLPLGAVYIPLAWCLAPFARIAVRWVR
jgi:uncharacterized membrane protein